MPIELPYVISYGPLRGSDDPADTSIDRLRVANICEMQYSAASFGEYRRHWRSQGTERLLLGRVAFLRDPPQDQTFIEYDELRARFETILADVHSDGVSVDELQETDDDSVQSSEVYIARWITAYHEAMKAHPLQTGGGLRRSTDSRGRQQ